MNSRNLARSSLARSSLYPVARPGGNGPVAAQKESSDAPITTTTRGGGTGHPVDRSRIAADECKGNLPRRRSGGTAARAGRPRARGGDSRHRPEGDLPLSAAWNRPVRLRRAPDRMHTRRHDPHRLPKPGLPRPSPSSPSKTTPDRSVKPHRGRTGECRQGVGPPANHRGRSEFGPAHPPFTSGRMEPCCTSLRHRPRFSQGDRT